jgi:hypothetical protein
MTINEMKFRTSKNIETGYQQELENIVVYENLSEFLIRYGEQCWEDAVFVDEVTGEDDLKYSLLWSDTLTEYFVFVE